MQYEHVARVDTHVRTHCMHPVLASATGAATPHHRIIVAAGNRKMQPELVGQEGEVKEVLPSGWARVHLPALNAIYEIQQRYLTPAAGKDAAAAGLRHGSIQLLDLPPHAPGSAGRDAQVRRWLWLSL